MERFVWIGPVRHLGGYGEVARNYVRGLSSLGAEVALVDSNLAHREIGETATRDIERLLEAHVDPRGATVVYHMAPPELPGVLRALPMPGAARRVACTITECDRLPADWVAGLEAFDEVWVPGTFHVESFAASGVPRAKLRRVPYGVDTAFFRPGPARPRSDAFRFLYTFQFDWRKGFDLLLEAYLGEFTRDEPTELVVKVFDTQPGRSPRAELARAVCDAVDLFRTDLPRVTVLDRAIDREELVELYRSADLYVSTDRANGWGMPCHEAMACGRPAAAIDWSGSTEFMHSGNSLAIPPGELTAVDRRLSDARPEYAGLRWPAVAVEDVRAVLRGAFEDRERLDALASRGRDEIRSRFSLTAAAESVLTREPPAPAPRDALTARVRRGLGLPPNVERTLVGWAGPVNGRSGYASAGRATIGGLRALGHEVRLWPLDLPAPGVDGVDAGPQDRPPDVWVVHCLPVNPDGTRPWESFRNSLDGVVIGATCFESAGLPASWVEAMEPMTEIWVPSPFNARTFAAAGVDPGTIHVVPYPVDTALFTPGDPAVRDEGVFSFLSVFEWTWRKGWDVLLRAFVEEFDAAEPVRLRILTGRHAGALGPGDELIQAAGLIESLGRSPASVADIDLLLDPVSPGELVRLYRSSYAFVLASRGEGMGMPVLEAMACGLPVIATDHGGYQHLMDERHAFPVAVESTVTADPLLVADNPLYAGQTLVEPSVASLRRRMREAYSDRAGAAARAAEARIRVERTHGPEAAAAAAISRIAAHAPATPAGLRVGASL